MRPWKNSASSTAPDSGLASTMNTARSERSRSRTPSAWMRILPNSVPNAPRKSCRSWVKGSPKALASEPMTILLAARTSAPACFSAGANTDSVRSSRKRVSRRGASRKSSALREGGVSSTIRS